MAHRNARVAGPPRARSVRSETPREVVMPPPGGYSLPYLGDTIPLLTDTLAYVARRRARYGDVWSTRFMGQRAAVAVGAEAQRQVLENNAQFPAAPGYTFVKPLLGNSLFALDGAEHARQRRLMTPAFSSRQYPAYVERIASVLDRVLATWTRSGAEGQRTFHHDALAIMFAVSCSLAAGIEVGPDYQHLLRRWLTMQAGLLNPIRLDLPGMPWHASLGARRSIQTVLTRTLQERRAGDAGTANASHANARPDILSLLLQAQAADNTLTDEQIVDHLILLLFAGYETTAGAVSWLLIELLRHPDEVLARVRSEVRADDHDARVELADLTHTPYLDAVIKETLRLHPAQHLSIRGVTAPWTYAGRTIPAGWSVLIAPMYTHRMPEYFAEPERFDPERFLPPREEDRKHPYALIEFGGGAHACLGSGIAKVVMKAVVTTLLRRFELSLVARQDFSPVFIPAGRPKGGARIRYRAFRPVSTTAVASGK